MKDNKEDLVEMYVKFWEPGGVDETSDVDSRSRCLSFMMPHYMYIEKTSMNFHGENS